MSRLRSQILPSVVATLIAAGLLSAQSIAQIGTIPARAVSTLSGLGTGVATALGINVGSAGAVVVNGGALGTPSSGTLTSATGLPISTGVSGLGTGVATALAVNVGSAGAPVVFNGALGTPSSGTLTNATGLPVSTGISGLGTGVATVLGANVGADSGLGAVRISQIVTASSQSTVDFTSIAGTYSSLRVVYHSRDTASGTGTSALRLRINNDSTAGNYTSAVRSGTNNTGTITSQVAASSNGGSIGDQPNDGNTAGITASGEVRIATYAGTSFHKRVLNENDYESASAFVVMFTNFRWASTSAITRLTFITDGTAFKDGSVFTLYGVP